MHPFLIMSADAEFIMSAGIQLLTQSFNGRALHKKRDIPGVHPLAGKIADRFVVKQASDGAGAELKPIIISKIMRQMNKLYFSRGKMQNCNIIVFLIRKYIADACPQVLPCR